MSQSKTEAAGEWVENKAKQGEHALKQTGHEAARKINTEVAKDSNVPAVDRIKAAGTAISEGVQELTEGGKKKIHESKAESNKDQVLGTN